MKRITSNLSGRVRREILAGRDYLVAPVSLIVPGVLNGSKGPLYYPLDEISKSTDDWNGMPITVYHPKRNGKFVSARDPGILDRHGVGMVLRSNTKGKLRAEAWLDVENANRVDPRIVPAVERGDRMEISTGLLTTEEHKPGTFNGVAYRAIVRDYKPDHLAILPDEEGACSLNDGCGLNTNTKRRGKKRTNNNCGTGSGGFKSGNKCQKGGGGGGSAPKGGKAPSKGGPKGGKAKGQQKGRTPESTKRSNELHAEHVTMRDRMSDFAKSKGTTLKSMAKKDGFKSADEAVSVAIKSRRMGYKSIQEASKKLGVPVSKLSAKFAAMKVNSRGLASLSLNGKEPLVAKNKRTVALTRSQRKSIVDGLIGNCACQGAVPWKESDRETLNELTDPQLLGLKKHQEAVANEHAVAEAARKGFHHGDVGYAFDEKRGKFTANKLSDDDDESEDEGEDEGDGDDGEEQTGNSKGKQKKQPKPKQKPVANKKAPTEEEWLRSAPKSVQRIVRNSLRAEAARKDRLIELINNHAPDEFDEDFLKSLTADQLVPIARTAARNSGEDTEQDDDDLMPNYAGAAAPLGNTRNRRGEEADDDDALELPTMNAFMGGGKKAKKKKGKPVEEEEEDEEE